MLAEAHPLAVAGRHREAREERGSDAHVEVHLAARVVADREEALAVLRELRAEAGAGLVGEEQLVLRVGLRVPDRAQEPADALRLAQVAGEEAGVAGLGAVQDVLGGILAVALDAEAAVLAVLQAAAGTPCRGG